MTKEVKAKLDFKALRQSRSANILHRSLSCVDIDDLPLSDLVRLKALYAKLIEKDGIDAVPDAVLDSYIHLFSDRPLILTNFKTEPPGVRHVSLLFSYVTSGPHFTAITNFASFLASMPSLDRVDIIFSVELFPEIWQSKLRKAMHKLKIVAAMKSTIADFQGLFPQILTCMKAI